MQVPAHLAEDSGTFGEVAISFCAPNLLIQGASMVLGSEAPAGLFLSMPDEPLRDFQGSSDIEAVAYGRAHYVHVNSTHWHTGDLGVPELGVYIVPGRIDLEWESGPAWSPAARDAFGKLLERLQQLGGSVAPPWSV